MKKCMGFSKIYFQTKESPLEGTYALLMFHQNIVYRAGEAMAPFYSCLV